VLKLLLLLPLVLVCWSPSAKTSTLLLLAGGMVSISS
jgi:hypothetical protein